MKRAIAKRHSDSDRKSSPETKTKASGFRRILEAVRSFREAVLRHTLVLLGISVVVAAVGLDLIRDALPSVRYAENWIYDLGVILLSATPATQDKDITIVAIDEQSVEAYPPRSPVSRSLVARLITMASDAGARAIGVDLRIDGPTSEDGELEKAIQAAHVPIILGRPSTRIAATPAQRRFASAFFAKVRARTAFIDLMEDKDGTVRSVPAPAPNDKTDCFSCTLASFAINQPPQKEGFYIRWRLPPRDARDTFAKWSAAFLIDKAKSGSSDLKSYFKDKIVVLCTDLTDIDQYRTSFTAIADSPRLMDGGLIHAHATAQQVEGRSVIRIGGPITTILTVLMAMVGAWFARASLGHRWRFAALFASAVYLVVCVVAFLTVSVALPVLLPAGAAPSGYEVARHLVELRRKHRRVQG